jgi:hypothetical protein
MVLERYAPYHSSCMSLMRSGYKELGLELVSLEEKISHTPKRPSMVGENKDDGTEDPFKLLLEESLAQQRNEMMDNFAQILRQLPTSTHLPRAEAPTPSRYISTLIFLYLKFR